LVSYQVIQNNQTELCNAERPRSGKRYRFADSGRRLFLAAVTAAAVCATLKGAAALEVDPIFAAIKRHNGLARIRTGLQSD
jgi:hypothetical protein